MIELYGNIAVSPNKSGSRSPDADSKKFGIYVLNVLEADALYEILDGRRYATATPEEKRQARERAGTTVNTAAEILVMGLVNLTLEAGHSLREIAKSEFWGYQPSDQPRRYTESIPGARSAILADDTGTPVAFGTYAEQGETLQPLGVSIGHGFSPEERSNIAHELRVACANQLEVDPDILTGVAPTQWPPARPPKG